MLLVLFVFSGCWATHAQQATEIDAKSVQLPRYSGVSAVEAAIPSAEQGMMVYDSQSRSLLVHDGSNWGDVSSYPNFRQFFSNAFFTVPAGVSKVLVEIWSGGGGGNGLTTDPTTANSGYGSGGGGGGYGKAIFAVSPGTVLTITVGAGGVGGSGGLIGAYVPATNGGASSVASSSQSISIPGGGAALNNASGRGTATFTPTNLVSYQFVPGRNGSYKESIYNQISATEFVKIDRFGKGGEAANSPDSGGAGGTFTRNMTTLAAGVSILAESGRNYGGGGGGSFPPAGNGANGMVMVHY